MSDRISVLVQNEHDLDMDEITVDPAFRVQWQSQVFETKGVNGQSRIEEVWNYTFLHRAREKEAT